MAGTRALANEVLATITYNGEAQQQVRLNKGMMLNGLTIQMDATYDVTGSTANPHPAGLINLIDTLEVATNNGKVIHNLAGQDLYELFGFVKGVEGDNIGLHAGGAIANDQKARQTVYFPFHFEDGQREDDAVLQTFTQDVVINVKFKKPSDNGSLYGTATGLVVDNLSCKLEAETWRATADAQKKLLAGFERSLKRSDYGVNQTSDAFQIADLPRGELYRGIHLMARSTVNNMTQGNSSVIDHDKEMAVKFTFENTTLQRGLVRGFRSRTLQKRGRSNVTAGVIDVPFLKFGSIADHLESTTSSELFAELPVVNTGTSPFVRVVTDIFRQM